MTKVILIRHGQTEWNRVERFRGRMDLPLNDTGHAQARAAATWLKPRYPIAAVYSSPLVRCLDTATPLTETFGLGMQILEGLVDIDYGQWQGLTPEEMGVRWPELHRLWYSEPQRVEIPGGESLAAVRERAATALAEVVARHQQETVALVSHQVICKVLLLHVLGLGNDAFWRIQQDNGAINVFNAAEQGFVIQVMNHTCHLEGIQHGDA